MWIVCACLAPGIAVMTVQFGVGYFGQLVILVAFGWIMEALCLFMQRQQLGRSWRAPLTDGSVVLTCLLLGLALPPDVPLGILAIAALGAVGLAKHLFGGLGNTLFNPAMVGYCLVLVSFPVALANWPIAIAATDALAHSAPTVDALSAATPLEQVSHGGGTTFLELSQSASFGSLGGLPWQGFNLAFLGGGLVLWVLKLIQWRVTLGVLVGIAVPALAFYDNGSSNSLGSVTYHWFTGGTMLCAFFIATDPVTHPSSRQGQWAFGLLVGVLVFSIRAFGSYADGVAFAILLANSATPWLDALMRRDAIDAVREAP